MTLEEAKQIKPGSTVWHHHFKVTLKNYLRVYQYNRDENFERAVVKHKSGNLQTVNTIDLHLEDHLIRRKDEKK